MTDSYTCDVCGQRLPAAMLNVGEVIECDDCLDARIRAAFRDAHADSPLTIDSKQLKGTDNDRP